MDRYRVRFRVIPMYSTCEELEKYMKSRTESVRGSIHEDATHTPERTFESLRDDYEDPSTPADVPSKASGGDVLQLRRHRARKRKR